jgi:hypothetical protein
MRARRQGPNGGIGGRSSRFKVITHDQILSDGNIRRERENEEGRSRQKRSELIEGTATTAAHQEILTDACNNIHSRQSGKSHPQKTRALCG